jgi:PIN domain nuclease of toxin-antitoxin system
VRLLLDTHVAIWALTSPDLLGPAGRSLVADSGNEIFVSAASVWEIAIKHALGPKRGAPPFSGAEAVAHFRDAGYVSLDVTAEHAAAVEDLPAIHADPFDRLLVAQARREPMRLLTADPVVARYDNLVMLLA